MFYAKNLRRPPRRRIKLAHLQRMHAAPEYSGRTRGCGAVFESMWIFTCTPMLSAFRNDIVWRAFFNLRIWVTMHLCL